MKITHLNENNHPRMVDVGQKPITQRIAVASGKITMSKEAYEALKNSTAKKGPVLQTAIISAIMGAKKTSDLIPMCHPIPITAIDIDVQSNDFDFSITLVATLKTDGKTGIEMEALMSVSIGLLTIYDMLKAIDKTMCITDVCLLEKSGGKNGDFQRERKGEGD